MKRDELLWFLRRYNLAVQATVGPDGTPQAAVVGYAVTDGMEVVFDTVETTRKSLNLQADPRVALVIGWDDAVTVQIEGVADFPLGTELERLRECYFRVFPEGRDRLSWPGITHVRVRPEWVRYSDFTQDPPLVVEVRAAQLT